MFLGSEPSSSKVAHIYLKSVFERMTQMRSFQTGSYIFGPDLVLAKCRIFTIFCACSGKENWGFSEVMNKIIQILTLKYLESTHLISFMSYSRVYQYNGTL